MTSETKTCQNCKNSFIIEPEDFNFYEKIDVPLPTFCPKCRLQRRLAFFNLITLYKRKCDLCKQEVISMYSLDKPYKVYCPTCWWSDEWDAFDYGRDYDFSKPFFKQFNELWHEVPMLGLSLGLEAIENPYNNHAGHLKNCYLLFHAERNEDCAYGVDVFNNKSVFDCSSVMASELSYDCFHLFKSSRCIGCSGNVKESLNCVFLRDCNNCQNCFASVNLRSKKYHIFNKEYSKEDYFKEIKKYDLGSYNSYKYLQQKAEEHWKKFSPRSKYDDFSVNCTGSYVFKSKNCKECYHVSGAEDCKYLLMMSGNPIRNCYDISSWGKNQSLCYECSIVGEDVSNIRFSQESGIGLNGAEYCKLCLGGSNFFGCVSIKKGKYSIFNKRYTKESFDELRTKIIKHMNDIPYLDKKGITYKYGEFFPIELSSFAYNETLAQNFFPLSKTNIEKNGYFWKDQEVRKYNITMQANELPDHIKNTTDDILKEVISCENCGRGFKILLLELDFLRNINLPLPRECPFCRIKIKIDAFVKQTTLYDRKCDKCGSEFKTHYSVDGAEKIVCKKCYLEGVA